MPSMVSHSRPAFVDRPEAEPLADLYSIKEDLFAAMTFCDIAIKNFRQHHYRDLHVLEALAIAAVVTYVRCFVEGQRNWLHIDDMPELGPGLIAEHEFFYNLRHKCIAHSVNTFAEHWVIATVTVRDGQREPVMSVGPAGIGRIISAQEAERLMPLVQAVYEWVKQRIAVENSKVLDFVRSLPLDEAHAMKTRSSPASGDEQVAKKRKRHRQPVGRSRKHK